MKYTTGLAVIAALFSTSEAKFHGVAWGELQRLDMKDGLSVFASSGDDSETKSSSDSGSGSSSGDSG